MKVLLIVVGGKAKLKIDSLQVDSEKSVFEYIEVLEKIPLSIPNYILKFIENKEIDTIVWSRNADEEMISRILNALKQYTIVLSKSISNPKENSKFLDEKYYLKNGRFSVNNFGIKTNNDGIKMLEWWADASKEFGSNNIYHQQPELVLNLVPVFFEKVSTLKSSDLTKISLKYRIAYSIKLKLETLQGFINKMPPYWA